MNDILRPADNQNIGGNHKLQIFLFHDLFHIGDAVNGVISEIDVFNDSFIIDINCTVNSIGNIIKKKRTDKGTIYNVNIDAFINKTREEVRNELAILDNKKFVIVTTDNNNKIRLFGDLKNPMRLSEDTDTTGQTAANQNGYNINFKGEFTYRPYYIQPNFTLNYVAPLFQHIFYLGYE